ncbi:hypothetical protein [Tenacibaculum piscium]|uniref:hypothetical protein n=1 Tax=Tenacibaculum piscium TaxID=1458515 RepID=UPI001F359485|nr:hypothetical protein [Tenacibaculum piscium]
MPALVDGIWLEQYVEPQLLEEFKNFNDDFKWQKEDPKGLEKLAEKSPAEYDKMFNAKYNK